MRFHAITLFRGRFLRHKCAAGALALGLALLAACAETKMELQASDVLLLNKANNFYARQRFNQATASYRKLTEEYPDSNHRKPALIGLADSLYKEGQFDEANLYYERFVELYPMDHLTSRALFYYAMTQMMMTSNPERNQAKTRAAISSFSEFIERYPDNQLSVQADWYKKEMERMLSNSKIEVARFYYRTGKNGAAINRLKEFLAEYPGSPDAPEAMYLLGGCFMREQAYREAAEVFTALIGAHQDTKWAAMARADAGKLMVKAE